MGYHVVADAMNDDDSLGSIAGSIVQMQMANNANTQALSKNMLSIATPTNELWQVLFATQEQLAALA